MRGVDVSSHDGWPFKASTEVCYAESDFLIAKCTEGTGYTNPYFAKAMSRAQKDGKLLGMYHYANGGSASLEADYFMAHAAAWKGRAIPVLDFESYNNKAAANPHWARQWCERVHQKWGVWPMVYTYASMLSKVASCHPECPLWVAGYPTDAATWKVPKFTYSIKPWTEYAIWQFTSGHDTTDRNTSNLTAKEWENMANGTRTPLEVAVSQLGVKEQPANSNNVKYNTWYYGRKVSGSAYPWCAVFVAWCFDKAGDTSIKGVENRAYCPSYVTWAKRQGKWTSTPKVGALVLYDWNGDGVADHIGIVEKVVDKNTIQAVEGNTAVGNDSNGGEVMRRTRKLSAVLGFIDTHAEPKPEPKPKPKTSTKYKVTAKPSLNVRDRRSTVKGKVVGSIANGQTVELRNLKKNKVGNTWAEVASGKYKGRFVAVRFNGRAYAVKA